MSSQHSVVSGNNAMLTASCPQGQIAISGGFDTGSANFFARQSRPTPLADNPTGWLVEVHTDNGNSDDTTFTVYAMCVTPALPVSD